MNQEQQPTEQSIFEALASIGNMPEAYGDIVDTTEYMRDTPGWQGRPLRQVFSTTLYDRQDGRFRPYYETEIDLSIIRAMSWNLGARVPMAAAWSQRLVDYTIGTGFDWNITHTDARIQDICDRLVDEFMSDCDWSPGLERESYRREIEDGEFFASFVYESGQVGLIVHEAEELTEPLYSKDIQDYIQTDWEPVWTFGVLTKPHRPSKPYGYHIVRDESGLDWDFIPSSRALHWKRNVRSGAKRGISDFFVPHTYLSRGDKIIANTAEGTAVQAAIAYIVEHAPNVTGSQAAALTALARSVGQNPVTGQTERVLPSGTAKRLDVKNGQKYHAGPLAGTNNSQNYVAVMSAALRLAGTVMAFPEGMLTGDYGNNNYASAIVAQSPFVQGRLADQEVRRQQIQQMIEKVLALHCKHGRFRKYGYENFDDLKDGLKIDVIPAKIVPEDRLKAVQALAAEKAQGWVSDRTAATELGRDYETEVRQALESDIENRETSGKLPQRVDQPMATAISAIAEKVAAGALPVESGVSQLVMLYGLTKEEAQAIAVAPKKAPEQMPDGEGGAEGKPPMPPEEEEKGGEYAGLSRQQWKRNRQAIQDIIKEFQDKQVSDRQAVAMLGVLGIGRRNAMELLGIDQEQKPQKESAPSSTAKAASGFKNISGAFESIKSGLRIPSTGDKEEIVEAAIRNRALIVNEIVRRVKSSARRDVAADEDLVESLSSYSNGLFEKEDGNLNIKSFVNAVIESWAISSAHPISIALQQTVAEKMSGRNGIEVSNTRIKSLQKDARSSSVYDAAVGSEAMHAFVEAVYSATQRTLKKHGVEAVELYRKVPGGAAYKEGPASVMAEPLTSFSARRPESGAYMRLRVPAKEIFSIGGSGIGSLLEYETVVLGGKIAVDIVPDTGRIEESYAGADQSVGLPNWRLKRAKELVLDLEQDGFVGADVPDDLLSVFRRRLGIVEGHGSLGDHSQNKMLTLCYLMMASWCNTSGGSDPVACGMQACAAKEFSSEFEGEPAVDHLRFNWMTLGPSGDMHLSPQSRGEYADWSDFVAVRDSILVQKILRAQYNRTQAELLRSNVVQVTLSRPLAAKPVNEIGMSFTMQPLSSWSNGAVQGQGGVLRSDLPSHRILALPHSGFGRKEEPEFVVLGGPAVVKKF